MEQCHMPSCQPPPQLYIKPISFLEQLEAIFDRTLLSDLSLSVSEASMGPVDRQSSIENEPRTLKMNQIQYAREAALYVINTTTIEEAMRIFTEGLEPVECKAREEGDRIMMGNWREGEGQLYHEDELDDLQPLYQLRDIVSAPF